MQEKVAFLFAGQGSQYVGMGKDLYEDFPECKKLFDEAEEILKIPLKEYCFQGPQELLKTTSICQPAVFTVSIACFYAFNSKFNIPADFTLGLSLGEYSALVASKVLGFRDALKLVKRRAELMQKQADKSLGKMCAIIGLDREKIKEICDSCGEVYIANLNSCQQIVISGKKEKVDLAKDLCLKQGAKRAIDLEVNAAFHSPFMEVIAEEFKEFLKDIEFSSAVFPIISNVDALPKIKSEEIKEALVKQLYSPVLWEDSIKYLINQGINKFYEFGPGKVLKGLMRSIAPEAKVINIEKSQDIMELGS